MQNIDSLLPSSQMIVSIGAGAIPAAIGGAANYLWHIDGNLDSSASLAGYALVDGAMLLGAAAVTAFFLKNKLVCYRNGNQWPVPVLAKKCVKKSAIAALCVYTGLFVCALGISSLAARSSSNPKFDYIKSFIIKDTRFSNTMNLTGCLSYGAALLALVVYEYYLMVFLPAQ